MSEDPFELRKKRSWKRPNYDLIWYENEKKALYICFVTVILVVDFDLETTLAFFSICICVWTERPNILRHITLNGQVNVSMFWIFWNSTLFITNQIHVNFTNFFCQLIQFRCYLKKILYTKKMWNWFPISYQPAAISFE